MFKKSLAAKVSALTGILIALAIIVFASTFVVTERKTLTEDTIRSANIFATFSTAEFYRSYTEFYTRVDATDFQEFQKIIRQTMASNPDVIRVRLVAINGRVLMDSQEATDGRYAGPDRALDDEALMQVVQSGKFQQRDFAAPDTDGALFQFVVPVNAAEGVHVLSMVYSFGYASLQSQLSHIYRELLLTAVILLLIGLSLPSYFINRSIRPLRQLTRVVDLVGAGSFDVQIQAEGEDEIGVLGRAFAKMVTDLKKSRDELVSKISELERVIRVTIGRELKMIELKEELRKIEPTEPSAPKEPKDLPK